MSYQIRPLIAADIPGVVAIINAQSDEPTTVADIERGLQTLPESRRELRLVAIAPESGTVAAYGLGFTNAYRKPRNYFVRVRVEQAHQGRGLGRELADRLEAWAQADGAATLEADLMEDQERAVAFVELRGYTRRHHLFESTLALPDWDPTPFLDAIPRATAAGIRITTLAAEAEGEEMLQRYYELIYRLLKDVPVAGENPQPEYDQWRRWHANDTRFNPASVFLAVDGDRWVGMADLHMMPSGGIYNALTGVDRAYRGRGISMALKVQSLLWAREQGLPYIRTNNHSANQPMLAVNRKLGYVPAPGFFQYAKDL